MPYQTLRCDVNGETDDEGTYALAIATEVYTPVNGQNTVTTTVQYKLKTSSTWINAGTLTDGELQFGNGNILTSQIYNVRYTIVDSLGYSTVINDIISRSQWELHVKRGGGAWAFGGPADVDNTLHVYGGMKLDTPLPVDSGGTGASTKAAAKTALDIDDLEEKVGSFMTAAKTITSGNSGTYTFDGFCSFCILISGSVVGDRCIIMGHCTTAGNISHTKLSIGTSDDITVSTTTNKLTINNGASQACYTRLIRVSSSGTMPI